MLMTRGTGWVKDPHSSKDYTVEHPEVLAVTEKLNLVDSTKLTLQRAVDLRSGFLPVIDQGPTNGCSGCASVALFEYSLWLTRKKLVKSSGMFVYKVARNLIHAAGDSGAYPRANMKALALVGVCPEEFWPFYPPHVNLEPPAICYAVAKNFAALKYYRLDGASITPDALLQTVKAHLATKIPAMFGVFLPPSITQWSTSGRIPCVMPWNPPRYGHAMVAMGYNDDLVIETPGPQHGFVTQTRGALLVRNSWGSLWGEQGYGWLPYEYVLNGLTGDWWCLISSTWVDLDVFAAAPSSGAGP